MYLKNPHLETATFGAGCFWCLDAIARRTRGVISSVVGYSGGSGLVPTYETLHADHSGYIEAVQLEFDPMALQYSDILDLFFRSHDPTTPNQDGANFGPEYHSTIFYRNRQQRDLAEAAVAQLAVYFDRPIVTAVRPFDSFSPAESIHQNFYEKRPNNPYCRYVIVPKLAKLGLR